MATVTRLEGYLRRAEAIREQRLADALAFIAAQRDADHAVARLRFYGQRLAAERRRRSGRPAGTHRPTGGR